MLEKIAERIDREGMFAEDGPVGVAVSGGPDSVALLHALRDLLGARPFAVLHVNHGLRGPESDLDEEFVRGLAESLECEFHARRCDLSPGHCSAVTGRWRAPTTIAAMSPWERTLAASARVTVHPTPRR